MSQTSTESTPTGYECPNCKQTNKFSAWVYAHWRDQIVHTCDCGRQNNLRAGRLLGQA